jgi:hypothetical protein
MNTKNAVSAFVVFAFISCLSIAMSGQTVAAQKNQASAVIEMNNDHIHGGDEVVLKITLNEPLPKEARFDIRLSPVEASQQITGSSGEPLNDKRTEFKVKVKLPDEVIPGEWHIAVIYLFLPGSSWTTNTIQANDLRFVVEGRKFELPTKATAIIVKDKS